MGKIRTYERQLGTPDAEVKSSASTRPAEIMDEANQKLGRSISNFEDAVYKSQVQKDITSTHLKLSELRNHFTNRIQEETQKGTINAESLQQEYQDEVNKITGSASTREGTQYFERESIDIGSQLIRSASISQAQVVAKQSIEAIETSLQLNTNTLQKSPAEFQSILDSSNKAIDEMVSGGSLDSTSADEIKRKTAGEFAQNAVRGWANISPDTAEKVLDQGLYDKYLSGDQKKQLLGEVRTYKTAAEIEKNRREELDKEQQKKIQDAWENKNLASLEDRSISTKQILDSPLSPQRKIQWMNMLKTNLKESQKTDPTVKNELTRRVLLPDGDPNKITDTSQLYKYVGSGLTITDLKQVTSLMGNTPEGAKLRDNRKRLLDFADATLAGKNPITGQPDPQGAFSLSLFTNALAEEEERLRKENKDISALYDPTSKEYFGHKVFKYKASPQEIMQRSFDFKELQIPEDSVRQDGESAEDYLKRLGQ